MWLRERLRRLAIRMREMGVSSRDTFAVAIEQGWWRERGTVCGAGSTLAATEALRARLPGILSALDVEVLLDAPCGDFAWMSRVDRGRVQYVGVDIVESLILQNAAKFSGPGVRFECADLTRGPLPRADLILCRDCWIHLPFFRCKHALREFARSGAKHLLISNSPQTRENVEVWTGGFRTLNLRLPPFRFPAPLDVIDEGGGRELCLYAMSDLDPTRRRT